MRNCVTVAQQTLTLFVWVQILVPQPKRKTDPCGRFFLFFDCESSRLEPSSRSEARDWVHIPRAKIGKLACQAQREGIFAESEYPGFFIHCESNGIFAIRRPNTTNNARYRKRYASRFSVYLIRFDEHISSKRVYHQPQAVYSFAMMIYNTLC